MNFPIELRHIETGLAKVFNSVKEAAEFLGQRAHEEWEGWHPLKELAEFKEAFAAAAADPIGQGAPVVEPVKPSEPQEPVVSTPQTDEPIASAEAPEPEATLDAPAAADGQPTA